jgi:hypothetical protein
VDLSAVQSAYFPGEDGHEKGTWDYLVLIAFPTPLIKGADEEPNSGDLDKRFQTSSRIPTRQHHSHG